MIKLTSMTGFGAKEGEVLCWGKMCVELRSSNHKFLEIVFRLPEGFLFLESRIKEEIEAKIKRGRVSCVINMIGSQALGVSINNKLLKNYLVAMENIREQFHLKDDVSMDTLMHLPGVLSLTENRAPKAQIWPALKVLVNQALEDLVRMRQKEGKALCAYLKNKAQTLKSHLTAIEARFQKALKEKSAKILLDEERASFIKEVDIAEEIERLRFHTSNFKDKIIKGGTIGKELDFIAQEMQREANTIGAKSFDVGISARVVQMKSQIEKIREQVQNVE